MKKFISQKSKVERQKTFFFVSVIALMAAAQTSAQENADTLSASDFNLQEVVVSAPVKQATVSRQEIRYEELNRDNTGQNLPVLLSNTPSLVTTSDDGLGVGYTYFRVRGSDHTRINMTINEVPLNDAESQTVFWVNMTDISSSITKLDVQRGIGTSANGGSSFGASINISTIDNSQCTMHNAQCPQVHGELSFNGGMYNTFREMAKMDAYWGDRNSKKGAWHVGGRFSKVNSDGYIDRAFSDLFSYQAQAGWQNSKNPFNNELKTAIHQLDLFYQKETALRALLGDQAKEAGNPFLSVSQDVQECLFANMKKLINRMTILDFEDQSRFPMHYEFIRGVIGQNQQLLNQYDNLIIEISQIGDSSEMENLHLDNITEALRELRDGTPAAEVSEQLQQGMQE